MSEVKCVHGHTPEQIAFYGCETNTEYHGVTIPTPTPPPTEGWTELKKEGRFHCWDCADIVEECVKRLIAHAVEAERERIRGGVQSLTHYYRSKFSQDCSRGETHEEKNTEMLQADDVLALLTKKI